MADETPKGTALIPKTIKVEPADLEIFNSIKDAMQEQQGTVTDTAVFSEIINRYNTPLRTNKENAEKVQQLQEQVNGQQQRIDELEQQLKEATSNANSNAEEANRQQLEYEQKIQELQELQQSSQLKETQRIVDFIPDNLKALQAVAARESKRRGQNWTVSHVINFFTHSRFIQGQLNGDLKSLSDAECKQLGIVTGKPKKMEVDI
jgi:predicted O-linked N-acetylglucosamine transferase (SPINDLY family)